MKDDSLIKLALSCGAKHATLLMQQDIVLNAIFRDICRSNGCGNYGRCYMCPPDAGEINILMDRVREYPCAMMYQTIYEIDDSYDIEGMLEAGKLHSQCSQKLEYRLRTMHAQGYLHLSAGGCRLCDRCTKGDGQPCRFPKDAMPSLEAYGVDVYNTAAHAGLKYINGQNTVTYFGMVLLSEE